MRLGFHSYIVMLGLALLTAITPVAGAQSRTINDLSVEEIVHYAQAAYMAYDFNPITARLLFHGLLNNAENVDLLQTTADTLVEDSPELSAIVFEYLYNADLDLSRKQQQRRDTMYSSAMWYWGLSTKKDDDSEVSAEDFSNASLFRYDRTGFRDLFGSVLAEAGSVTQAVRGVVTILGLYGGFLQHREGADYEYDRVEIFTGRRFAIQERYGQWLRRPIDDAFKELPPYAPQ